MVINLRGHKHSINSFKIRMFYFFSVRIFRKTTRLVPIDSKELARPLLFECLNPGKGGNQDDQEIIRNPGERSDSWDDWNSLRRPFHPTESKTAETDRSGSAERRNDPFGIDTSRARTGVHRSPSAHGMVGRNAQPVGSKAVDKRTEP
jgi:hypothetical protein